eukprot:gene17032-biopygen2917
MGSEGQAWIWRSQAGRAGCVADKAARRAHASRARGPPSPSAPVVPAAAVLPPPGGGAAPVDSLRLGQQAGEARAAASLLLGQQDGDARAAASAQRQPQPQQPQQPQEEEWGGGKGAEWWQQWPLPARRGGPWSRLSLPWGSDTGGRGSDRHSQMVEGEGRAAAARPPAPPAPHPTDGILYRWRLGHPRSIPSCSYAEALPPGGRHSLAVRQHTYKDVEPLGASLSVSGDPAPPVHAAAFVLWAGLRVLVHHVPSITVIRNEKGADRVAVGAVHGFLAEVSTGERCVSGLQ